MVRLLVMSNKLSKYQVIQRFKDVHGDKYDYSKVEYEDCHTKVCIICPTHGEFWQTPNHHFYKKMPTSCPKCGRLTKGHRIDVSTISTPFGSKAIPLTKGKYTLVDEEDYDKFKDINWYLIKSKGARTGYAACTLNGRASFMHRLILNPPSDMVIDHINGDGLDNRKFNLRVCSMLENMKNLPPRTGKTSQYKGVFKNGKLWRANIRINGLQTLLGSFSDEIEAAKAYDEAAKKYHKEFANLNFK